MSDLGRNEIADLKHEKPPAGSHFRPRALRALGRKWKPLGGFSCLRSAIPFLPSSLMQKLPIFEIFFVWSGHEEDCGVKKIFQKTLILNFEAIVQTHI